MREKQEKVLKGKKRKGSILKGNRIFYSIVLIFVIYISWIFISQQIALHRLYEQEAALKGRIRSLKQEEVRLKEEKKQGDNPEYIEKKAREQLKMVKPNEIIYIDVGAEKKGDRNSISSHN
jgi:cell division protein DivIC